MDGNPEADVLKKIPQDASEIFPLVWLYIDAILSYLQPAPSKTNISPETFWGGFCARAIAALDKTNFKIYIYGGDKPAAAIKITWALAIPYFRCLPLNSPVVRNTGAQVQPA
ncbi:hypothetical protein HOY80DRAFT_1030583 [Tuber brumale]|nr:hypothetical protein HOY80DRAFT_1030583 [Tuber brumale]